MNEIPVVNWTVSSQGLTQKQLCFLICAGRAVCLKILKLCSLPSKTEWSFRLPFSCLKASEERSWNSDHSPLSEQSFLFEDKYFSA